MWPALNLFENKTNLVLGCLLVVMLTACIHSNTNTCWTTIEANGIPAEHINFSVVNYANDSVGYVGGTLIDNVPALNAIIYKTLDRGKTWAPITLGHHGSIWNLQAFNDTLIYQVEHDVSMLSCIFSYYNGRFDTLYKAAKDERVRYMHFTTARKGYLVLEKVSSSISPYIVRITNGLVDTIATLPHYGFYKHAYSNDTIFSISMDGENTSTLAATSILTGKTVSSAINGRVFNCWVDNNGNLLYTVKVGNADQVYRRTSGKTTRIVLGAYAGYSVSEVMAKDSFMLAIATKPEDVAPTGVIYRALTSTDDGKTWKEEELPSPLQFSPTFLFDDCTFVAFGGLNRFQIRKPCSK